MRPRDMLGAARTAVGGRRRSAHARPPAPAATVTLTRRQIAGCAEIDRAQLRADIGGGYPGRPVHVRFTVVDATVGRAVPNALLEVHHADAPPRGIVITDKEGVAHVQTIRPTAASGASRTTALELRVFAGGDVAHTGRLLLPAGDSVAAVLRIERAR
ncbi:MAG: Dioxygenase [Conexibacter sp.]|nr:Dioxygenase [Conexibacter sp.]